MRKVADCRSIPSESGCTLTIAGEADEVLRAASEHAVSVHGHADGPGLRDGLAAVLTEEGAGTRLAQETYATFAQGDVESVLAVLDPSITWSTPPSAPGGGTVHGVAEVAAFFGRLGETYAELSVEPERFVEQGDTVVVLGRHRGRLTTGAALELTFVHVWTLRAGRVVAFEEAFDTGTLHALMAVPAPREASGRPLTGV